MTPVEQDVGARLLEIAEAVQGLVIEHQLRQARVATDTHVITVEEPSIWTDDPDLVTTIKVIDI